MSRARMIECHFLCNGVVHCRIGVKRHRESWCTLDPLHCRRIKSIAHIGHAGPLNEAVGIGRFSTCMCGKTRQEHRCQIQVITSTNTRVSFRTCRWCLSRMRFVPCKHFTLPIIMTTYRSSRLEEYGSMIGNLIGDCRERIRRRRMPRKMV